MKLVKSLLKSFAASQAELLQSDNVKRARRSLSDSAESIEDICWPAQMQLDGISELEYYKLQPHITSQLSIILRKVLSMQKNAVSKNIDSLSDTVRGPCDSGSIFGTALHLIPGEVVDDSTGLPMVLLEVMRVFVGRDGFSREGPFRIEGDKAVLASVIEAIKFGYELPSTVLETAPTAILASLIKRFYRQIPGSLISLPATKLLVSINEQVKDMYLRRWAIQLVLLSLPYRNFKALLALLALLQACSFHASEHKMSASGLAVCLGPSLFDCGMDLPLVNASNNLLTNLITHRDEYVKLKPFYIK